MGHAFGGCAGDLPGNIVGVFFAGAHRAHCFFLPDNGDFDTFCFIKVIVDGEQPSQGGATAGKLACHVLRGVSEMLCACTYCGTVP